jgi:STIP1 family protein 1
LSPPEAAAARTTRARRLRTPGLRALGETDEGFVAREDVDAPPSPPRPKAPGRSRGVPGETRARTDAAGIADAAGDMASTSFSGPALRESDVVHPPDVFKSTDDPSAGVSRVREFPSRSAFLSTWALLRRQREPRAAARLLRGAPMSAPDPAAEELKAQGNALYQRGKWGAAIDAYTDAILIAPRWLPVILNRALCHRKRKNWNAVKEDCLKALDIDRESIKANYMLGLSLIASRNYREASRSLRKALENARASGATIKDEIWRELARANYLQWELDAAARATRLEKVRSKILPLMRSSGENTTVEEQVIDLCSDDAPSAMDATDAFGRDADASEKRREEKNVNIAFDDEDRATLEEMFVRFRERDARVSDPPDCFCCVLTFEVFRDPVVAPSGNSYERSAITEHLKKVGGFDPVTRERMTLDDLRPNVALRNAAHAWLDEHAWAYADIVKPDAPLGGEED